jgi:1-aminocyclopropane-1-carboxylate deaminase/D-cysteine desulfhydrase-like pyridoxal-dependent ACC family enzyme
LIGRYPTPVTRVTLGPPHDVTLSVKHDDETSALYGGNKVRKLERILERARERKKTRILTVGAAGSHHVLATAIHAGAAGFRVHAVLVPQPETKHALYNIRAAFAAGLTAEPAMEASLHVHVLAAMDANTEYVGLGGSNVVGSLGYFDAAEELEAQVDAGLLPEPEEIVVALGSGGTVAGLLCGLEKTKLASRVVGVAIARPVRLLRVMAKRLTKKIAQEVGVDPARAFARLVVDGDSVGRGYGYATPEGEAAVAIGAQHGIKLDPTYTAKTFAAAVKRAKANPEGRTLFWNTLSSADLMPLVERAPESQLPPEIRRLFR